MEEPKEESVCSKKIALISLVCLFISLGIFGLTYALTWGKDEAPIFKKDKDDQLNFDETAKSTKDLKP